MMEPEVFCAETVMSIPNVASKFAVKETLNSNTFLCQQDPCPVLFKIQLHFGLPENYVSGDDDPDSFFFYLKPLNRDVFVKRLNFFIHDHHGNSLLSLNGRTNTKCEMGHWFCGKQVETPPTTADVVWRCSVKIHYQASSSGDDYVGWDLLKMLESAESADIAFSVKGEEIKAHKVILMARSKYFAAMFQSKLAEDSAGKIEVTDADPKVFWGILEYLYSGLPPKQLDDIALDLFIIADKYGIDELRDICELNLRAHLNTDNVVDALLLAERHNLQDLMAVAKVVFRANRDVLMQSEENREKLTLDPDLLLKLI